MPTTLNTDFSPYNKNKNTLVYYVFVFSLVFGVVLYDFIDRRFGFSYIDEIIAFLLLILCFTGWKLKKEIIFFIAVFSFYLCKSLLFPNNITAAIFTDFVVQIKPFIAFYAIYELGFDTSESIKKNIRTLCIFLAICLLPIGIFGFGGKGVMNFFCGMHSRYATSCTALAMTYLLFSQHRKKDYIISLLILTLSLASLRSKAVGFYGIFAATCFFSSRIQIKKLLTAKIIFFVISAFSLGLYLSWDKLYFYFVTGGINSINENTMFARPLLYAKAGEILKDYPLFGSGFGTYATFASGKFYSPIYAKYGLIYNNQIGNGMFIADTFYPSLAQFGFSGIFLYILFWVKRVKEAYNQARLGKPFVLLFVFLTTVFFLIEGIADSTFTHNRGMFMLMLLAIALRNNKYEQQ